MVTVFSKPTVGILSTGSELLADVCNSSTPERGKIRDCNRPMLMAAAAEDEIPAKDLGTQMTVIRGSTG